MNPKKRLTSEVKLILIKRRSDSKNDKKIDNVHEIKYKMRIDIGKIHSAFKIKVFLKETTKCR